MRLTRTIRLPLQTSPADVLPTLIAYTKAFNLVCSQGWTDSDSNGISLHKKTYEQCKALGLPSQLCCSARVRATEALKSVQVRIKKGKTATCPKSKLCPVRLDARSFSIWLSERTCTIRLLDRRATFNFKVPKYYEQFLTWKPCSADLLIKQDKVFLHLTMEHDIEDPVLTGNVVGVDAGIKRTAVTSSNQFFGGGVLSHVSSRYKHLRRILQKKGHSGTRHLARVKSKENRFVRDMLHVVSRKIVDSLQKGDVIAMEDLNGIRDRTKLRKKTRTMLNQWAFSRLQFCIQYKAEARGCGVVMVNPKYTSQGCSKCGHVEKANRKSQSLFECKRCGHSLNADLNGSRNIALRGKMQVATGNLHGVPPTTLDARC
jgi:IS605 OrfB family transposase